MTYFEGFIVPVPEANKAAYQDHATTFAPLVQKIGVGRTVESWDDDVPEGKLTDFRRAVDATPDEKIVLSWFEYPNRQARDATNEKFMSDPEIAEAAGKQMPFDGKRMVIGGFDAIVEEGSAGSGTYTDGFIVPVPEARREDYRALASKMAKVFRKNGANRVVEAFSDDVSHGKVTDFYRAVKAEDGEGVVFAFIEWPDKDVRDQAWAKIMADESNRPQEMPFDGKRMFWGGFEKIVDTAQPQLQQQQAPLTA